MLTDTLRSQWLASLRGSLTRLRLLHQQTIARQHSSPTNAAGTAIARKVMALPPALFSAPGGRCGGGEGEGDEGGGGDGGATMAMMGCVTTASTVIETPATLTSIAVALLGLLVALVIADCTEVAMTVGVRMRTPTMTLPDVTVNSTADGSTPARAAIALFISARTLGVKEETSPASSWAKSTTLIAGDGGFGDGGGEGSGGEGEGGGGGGGCGSGGLHGGGGAGCGGLGDAEGGGGGGGDSEGGGEGSGGDGEGGGGGGGHGSAEGGGDSGGDGGDGDGGGGDGGVGDGGGDGSGGSGEGGGGGGGCGSGGVHGGEGDGGETLGRGLGGGEAKESEDATKSRTEHT